MSKELSLGACDTFLDFLLTVCSPGCFAGVIILHPVCILQSFICVLQGLVNRVWQVWKAVAKAKPCVLHYRGRRHMSRRWREELTARSSPNSTSWVHMTVAALGKKCVMFGSFLLGLVKTSGEYQSQCRACGCHRVKRVCGGIRAERCPDCFVASSGCQWFNCQTLLCFWSRAFESLLSIRLSSQITEENLKRIF